MLQFLYQESVQNMSDVTQSPAISSDDKHATASVMTEAQIERIAERAAEIAVKKMTDQVYRSVGKNVVEKALYILGAISLAGYFWAKSNVYIK